MFMQKKQSTPGVLLGGRVALLLIFRIVFFVVDVLYVFILCLVPNVACVSGLFIFDRTFDFL